jgi:hypothetical protein
MKQNVIFVVFLCAFGVVSQAQVNDKRLMSDADYKTFLLQVEVALPKWEMALKNIDPEKDSEIPYSLGKSIVENRDVGLMEIGEIRIRVAKLRVKRTVSDELALYNFLQSLHDSIDEEGAIEAIANLTLSDLKKFASELSALRMRIGNDVIARVALLEKGTCP